MKTEQSVKHFDELTTKELFDIYKLRTEVFVVEQECPYQEVDDADLAAYHIVLRDADGIAAYLRVLPKGILSPEYAALGWVIAAKRGCGLGAEVVCAGIRTVKEKFGNVGILIEAQSYAQGFYEKQGFVRISEEFLEDGIPHVRMLRMPEM